MSIFTNFPKVEENVEADFEGWWNVTIKPVLKADIEPALKKFVSLFATQTGHLALTTALEATTELAAGQPFAAVATTLGTGLLSGIEGDAETDVPQLVTQVLSALQVAKAVNGVVTPGDTAIAAAVTQAASTAKSTAS